MTDTTKLRRKERRITRDNFRPGAVLLKLVKGEVDCGESLRLLEEACHALKRSIDSEENLRLMVRRLAKYEENTSR